MIPTPAIFNGSLYVSGGFQSRQYYAFKAETGALDWAIDLDDDGPSAPVIADGAVIFNTESCTIFACDLVSGKPIWSYYLGDPLMSMPTVHDGIVFTSYPASFKPNERRESSDTARFPSHVLIAIELRTGRILWQKWIDSDILSAPVARDEWLYITTFSGALYKVHQKTGDIAEAKAVRATSAPVFDDKGELVISQRSDTEDDSSATEVMIYGLKTKDLKVNEKKAAYLDKTVQAKARFKKSAESMDAGNGFASGAPASANAKAAEKNIGYTNVSALQAFQGSRSLFYKNAVYATMGDEVICTDAAGTVKWKHKLDGHLAEEGGFLGAPPIAAGPYVIVAAASGQVLLFDPGSGKLVRQYRLGEQLRYQPLVDKGWIYVTSASGRLHAIDTGDPSVTGWPMWGGNAARTNKAVGLQ
jgi:outer membrane protein assembly factor BamB